MPEPATAPREHRHFREPPRSPPFAPWRGPTDCLTGETALAVAYLVGPFFLAQREALSLCRSLLTGSSRHGVWAAAEPRPTGRPGSEAAKPGRPDGEAWRDQGSSPSKTPPEPRYSTAGPAPPPTPDGAPRP